LPIPSSFFSGSILPHSLFIILKIFVFANGSVPLVLVKVWLA
jgi:hypothetical protein